MIRCSALYISLIISIVIVLVCGSLLMIAHTYKIQDMKYARKFRLRENLKSATVILMEGGFKKDTTERISLFGSENDSVLLERKYWGIYELGLVKSWINTDTVKKAFLIGHMPKDSLKAIELTDEDRPLSITGQSLIRGTAYLPKSGIKAGYVESEGYTSSILVHGGIKKSSRVFPKPDSIQLNQIRSLSSIKGKKCRELPDTIRQSFFEPQHRIHLENKQYELKGLKAIGNVVILSDSLIVIDTETQLDKVILIAPFIKIQDNFKGNVQAIATDSIVVGDHVKLSYPSALLVLKNDTAKYQVKLKIGKNTQIEGALIAYEKDKSQLIPVIQLGEGTQVSGEVWAKGYAIFNKRVKIYGCVSAIRFIARSFSTIYENYLIDVTLDRTGLSKYYLSSKLINPDAYQKRLLCWLN